MNVRCMMIDGWSSKGVNSLFWIDVCVDIYKLLMITTGQLHDTVRLPLSPFQSLFWKLLNLLWKSLQQIYVRRSDFNSTFGRGLSPFEDGACQKWINVGWPRCCKMSHLLSSTFTCSINHGRAKLGHQRASWIKLLLIDQKTGTFDSELNCTFGM